MPGLSVSLPLPRAESPIFPQKLMARLRMLEQSSDGPLRLHDGRKRLLTKRFTAADRRDLSVC